MKSMIKTLARDEKGMAMMLALILLLISGLIAAPLLSHMGTGLVTGEVYETRTAEVYAADAGVEDALWKLQHELELPAPCNAEGWKYPDDDDPPFEFELNGKNVQVKIEYLEYDGEGAFKITSIASTDSTSSATIVAYVAGNYTEGTIEYDYRAGDGEIIDEVGGDTVVYGEGDLTITGNIQDSATVYVEGDLDVGGNIEGDSVEVYVKGDLTMSSFGNIEDTAIVCIVGNLYIGHCSEDGVQVYVEGNLIGVGSDNGIENEAKVCVEGDITVDKIEGGPTVCAGGTLTAGEIEGGYIYADGYSNPFDDCLLCSPDCPDCRICCECPLIFAIGEGSWEAWAVATYDIDP